MRSRVLLGAAAAVVILGVVVDARTGNGPAEQPPGAAASSPTTAGTPTESPSGGVPSPTTPPQSTQAADTATRFVAAWTSRKATEPAAAWLNRMRPYASPVLLRGLAVAAPDAVLPHRVTGPAVVTDSGQYGAQVTVPVDTGPDVLCTLASDGTRWLVTSITPEER